MCLSCSLPRAGLRDWPQFTHRGGPSGRVWYVPYTGGHPGPVASRTPALEKCVCWPRGCGRRLRGHCKIPDRTVESRARRNGSHSTQLAMHVRTLEKGAPPQDTLLPSVQKCQKRSASLCCPGRGRHLPDQAARSLPRGASLPATLEDSDPSPGQGALGYSSRFGGRRVGGWTCLVSRPWVVPAASGSCWVGCAVRIPGSCYLPGEQYGESDCGSPSVAPQMSPGCLPSGPRVA